MASRACRALGSTLTLATALMLAGCFEEAAIERSRADMAIAWNERVLTIAEAEDHFLTLKGVRTAAMMHAAMHDALNAVHRRYHPYAYGPDIKADPIAAAAQAAYEVAVSQYPDQRSVFDQELQSWLATTPPGRARDRSVALGRAAAAATLALRDGDGWDTPADYQW